jgi:hypothetical protein
VSLRGEDSYGVTGPWVHCGSELVNTRRSRRRSDERRTVCHLPKRRHFPSSFCLSDRNFVVRFCHLDTRTSSHTETEVFARDMFTRRDLDG